MRRVLSPALLSFLLSIAVFLAAIPAFSQSARASFLLQMARTNRDPRVRLTAALRLGELREQEAVPTLLELFSEERDPTVLAAMVAAFGSIGDPRAIPTVQGATRHSSPAVTAQARRALTALNAAARASGQTQRNTPSTASPTVDAAQARFLVGLGRVNNRSGFGGDELARVGQEALRNALSRRGEVVLHAGTAAEAQRAIRERRLRGHFFDATVQSVDPGPSGVRASVTIAVSSYPGRIYEFQAETSITLSGSSAGSDAARSDAVRRALEAAGNRAIDQLLRSPQL